MPDPTCSTRSGEIQGQPRRCRFTHEVDFYSSYEADFRSQYDQYEAQRELFLQAPSSATDAGIVSFRDLIDFVAHLADCYPTLTAAFPDQLIETLTIHHRDLEPELREKIVGSLVLLRKKDILDSSRYAASLKTEKRYRLMGTFKASRDALPYPYHDA